jgi:sugar phosphate isomerase/epimerase
VTHESLVSPNETRRTVKLQGAFPFRLGTTSYVIPADILPNLRYLRGRVDDVELVLFESDEFSNMPSREDVQAMACLGREADLTYTVHLPLDTRLGSANEAERVDSVGKCRRVIERMTPVEPFAWVLHLHGDHRGDPPTGDAPRWIERNRRSLAELLDGGPAPRMICVETLDYDFEWVANLVEAFDLSVCLDVGHLLVQGRNVAAHWDRWMDRAKVLHVHGVDNEGKDHCHLGRLPEGFLEELAERLTRLPAGDVRVVTMEVFGERDFERSMQAVAERLAAWRKSF